MDSIKTALKIDSNKIVIVAFVIILFIRSFILRQSETLSSDFIKLLLTAITWGGIFAVIFFYFQAAKIKIDKNMIALAACILFFFIYQVVRSYKYVGLDMTNAIVCLLIILQSKMTKSEVYVLFKKILIFEAVIGIVIFLIHITPFINLPHTVVVRQVGSGTYYANYGLSYILLDINGEVRLCGLFDEPGYFATFIAFFLCADNLNFKKKGNIILFIAGTLSFSMAYYFLLVTYFVLKNIRHVKKWIPLLIVLLFVIFVLPNIKTGNEYIDHIILRLSKLISSEKSFSMNGSRYDARFSAVVNSLSESRNLLLFGYGSGYVNSFKMKNNTVAESFLAYIVDYGIVGTVLIFVPLLFVVIKSNKNNYEAILYVVITFASLFQRPYFFTISYFMMFICGLAYIEKSKENSLENIRICKQEKETILFIGEKI